MAKVSVKTKLDKFTATLQKSIRTPSMLKEVAVFLRTRIYQYTKRGQSLVLQAKMPALSQGYIEFRKRLASGEGTKGSKKNRGTKSKKAPKKFGDFFSPSRSNLTLSGQMLDALESEVDQGKGQVSVFVDDTPRDDSDLNNAEVAKKVSQDGRPFLGLDRVGRDRIRRMVIAQLRRSLKRR